jgi:hypothetical protein
MNSDVEGSGPGLISGSRGVCTEELKKTTKPLSQVYILAKIQTGHVANSSQKRRYSFSS